MYCLTLFEKLASRKSSIDYILLNLAIGYIKSDPKPWMMPLEGRGYLNSDLYILDNIKPEYVEE